MTHPNRSRNAVHPNPSTDELIAFRRRYQLSERDASRIAMSTETNWKMWESGTRRMHPAVWAWVQHVAAGLPNKGA